MKPGIYFGLPEADYHAIPRLSSSLIKELRISPIDFWARSWMNPDRPDGEDTDAKDLGSGYHKRILEGREAFYREFSPDLVPSDHPEALRTLDDMKAALRDRGLIAGDSKHDRIARLVAIDPAIEPQIGKTIRTLEHLEAALVERGEVVGGSKADLAARLLAADPTVEIWDRLAAEHEAANEGKTLLHPDSVRRIETAAAMVEGNPSTAKMVQGGYPEVTILWDELVERSDGSGEIDVVPMKARIDYLKTRAIVDLKSFNNARRMPVDRCIAQAIANYRYALQAAVYSLAVTRARPMAAEGMVEGHVTDRWLEAFAEGATDDWQQDPARFVWLFVQTGVAPLARAKVMPRAMLFGGAMSAVESAMRDFALYSRVFGGDPWVDQTELQELEDGDLPAYAMEM